MFPTCKCKNPIRSYLDPPHACSWFCITCENYGGVDLWQIWSGMKLKEFEDAMKRLTDALNKTQITIYEEGNSHSPKQSC